MSFLARAILVVFFAIALALVAAPARADQPPRTFRLEVHADGADCPTAEDIRDVLTIVLGADPIAPNAPARLVLTLHQAGDLARGRWEAFGPDGVKLRERSVTTADTCRELMKGLALTFAVFYEMQPVPSVCDAACQAKAIEEARRQLIAAGYRPPMDPKIAILAGGLLSANHTADPGPGLFVAGEVHGEIFSAALEARVLFPSRVVSQPTGFPFELTTLGAALVPCARWKVLLGCLFFDVGALIAGGVVTSQLSGPPVGTTLGFGPRIGAHVPFAERFALRAFIDLRIVPIPTTFGALDTGSRWQTEPVSLLFGLGVGFE